jgi:hypothetical protein
MPFETSGFGAMNLCPLVIMLRGALTAGRRLQQIVYGLPGTA